MALALKVVGVADDVEFIATLLVAPVILLTVLGGRPLGYVAAVVAAVGYLSLRFEDVQDAGALGVVVLVLFRAGSYGFVAYVTPMLLSRLGGDSVGAHASAAAARHLRVDVMEPALSGRGSGPVDDSSDRFWDAADEPVGAGAGTATATLAPPEEWNGSRPGWGGDGLGDDDWDDALDELAPAPNGAEPGVGPAWRDESDDDWSDANAHAPTLHDLPPAPRVPTGWIDDATSPLGDETIPVGYTGELFLGKELGLIDPSGPAAAAPLPLASTNGGNGHGRYGSSTNGHRRHDAAAPAGAGDSSYGRSGADEPGYGQTGHDVGSPEPVYGQSPEPVYGRSGADEPGYLQTGSDVGSPEPVYGRAGGAPGTGEPRYGRGGNDRGASEPGYGRTGTEPGYGRTGGDLGAPEPSYGRSGGDLGEPYVRSTDTPAYGRSGGASGAVPGEPGYGGDLPSPPYGLPTSEPAYGRSGGTTGAAPPPGPTPSQGPGYRTPPSVAELGSNWTDPGFGAPVTATPAHGMRRPDRPGTAGPTTGETSTGIDPETRLWNAQFFRARLTQAIDASRRSGQSFSVVMIQVADEPFQPLPYRRQVALLRELGHQFVPRFVDHLVHLPDGAQHWFAVVLDATDREAAGGFEHRLRTTVAGYLRSRGLRVGDVQSASLTSPDDDEAMASIWASLLGADPHGVDA